MLHRTVESVMTRDVFTVRPDTPFKEIVALLQSAGIAGVPVTDEDGRPIGVVSEADLVRREADGPTDRHDVSGKARLAGLTPTSAETAAGVMSSPVVTARPRWSIVRAARLMEQRGLKRLPVVDDSGRLVGTVSRIDLLSPFLRGDGEIAAEIEADVLGETLWLSPGTVTVTVDDGVVGLRGTVPQRSLVPVIERLCASVDGVVAVHQELAFEVDDGPTRATAFPSPVFDGTAGTRP
ncbi:CBS domain-containing protein [Kitasatospora sp. NPDC059571]|uniref:CBS domain-containing protein n=1 Tax=Kitasatospora sp. NPDC059571 TaxID=3346871 RepID=UPI0036A193E2